MAQRKKKEAQKATPSVHNFFKSFTSGAAGAAAADPSTSERDAGAPSKPPAAVARHSGGLRLASTSSQQAQHHMGAPSSEPHQRSQRNPISLATTRHKPTTAHDDPAGDVPLSQGAAVVWELSPNKQLQSQHRIPPRSKATEPRRPLKDLIRCVAKPRDSAKPTPARNVAIEELMCPGDDQGRRSDGGGESGSGSGNAGHGAGSNGLGPQEGTTHPVNPFKRPEHRPPKRTLEEALSGPAPASDNASKRKSGGQRKQALFDVLQRVEKAIARKQAGKAKESPAPNPGPSAPAPPAPKIASDDAAHAPRHVASDRAANDAAEASEPGTSTERPAASSPKAPALALATGPSASAPGRQHVMSCVVLEVFDTNAPFLADVCPLQPYEKLARCMNVLDGAEVFLKLTGSWADVALQAGESVNVLRHRATADAAAAAGLGACVGAGLGAGGVVRLGDGGGAVLIKSPHVLVTGTTISAATKCTRQAALDSGLIRNYADFMCPGSSAAVLGTMKHDLIQKAITHRAWDDAFLTGEAKKILKGAYGGLFVSGLPEQEALGALQALIPAVQRFMQTYMQGSEGGGPYGEGGSGFSGAPGAPSRDLHAIEEVFDIEDYMSSTCYGMKGIVDVSVRARIRSEGGKGAIGGGGGGGAATHTQSGVMPLEIKTGKEWFTHRAQVAMYVLLMEEAHGQDVNHAVLWYTNQRDPKVLSIPDREKRQIIQARNFLVDAIQSKDLPPPIKDQNTCKRCDQLRNCMGMHRMVEGGTEASFGMRDGSFDRLTSHLTPTHIAFFNKWYKALLAEEAHGQVQRTKAIAGPRAKKAKGVLSVVLAAEVAVMHTSTTRHASGSSFKHAYRFVGADPGAVLNTSDFAVGDRVFLNAPHMPFQIQCRVQSVALHALEIKSSQRLVQPEPPGCDSTPHAYAHTHADVDADAHTGASIPPASCVWYVAKDTRSSMLSLLNYNLLCLMMDDRGSTTRVPRLRELIVDGAKPSFLRWEEALTVTTHDPARADLNAKQRRALSMALQAEDYALILGTPGSGKTSVIVQIVKALLARGESMLIVSHTNTAVDNILLRLLDECVDFVRIGNHRLVHDRIKPHMVGEAAVPAGSYEEYQRVMHSAKVVGCTCYNTTHEIFVERRFHYCIVDEASQISLPAVLGPLLKCQKFVLVGDNYQLPPLVMSQDASDMGMGRSLFAELGEAHPECVVFLSEQYRMAKDISDLSSAIVYSDRLKCGSEDVGCARIVPPNGVACIQTQAQASPWMRACLDPAAATVFVDTDGISRALETCKSGMVYNECEASTCAAILRGLVSLGISPCHVGMMSVYNMQVTLMKRRVEEDGTPGVEILTVDKFQGRDKSCIIVSLVRSNERRETGNLLRDWRRVNVALTRAKHKLILVGSAGTLSSVPMFDELLRTLDARGNVVKASRLEPSTAQGRA